MVNIRKLSPELQKKAIEELNEDPARIDKDIEAFKEWIKKSPHINGRTDDQFLVAFLRGCKFSLEKAKQKYDMFFTLKTHLPELCRNRDPLDPKILETIRAGIGVFLPNSNTPDGPRYLLIRNGCYDPNKISIQNIFKVSGMVSEARMLEDDNFIIGGQVGISDFTGIGVIHFGQFNPLFMKKTTTYLQDALPLRKKESHMVRMPQIALTFYNKFKSFLKEKNRLRISIHGDDLEELFKVVPKSLMPEEYGGDAGSLQSIIEQQEKLLMKYRDYFLEDEKYGVDETKRVGKKQNPESLFGLEGSFRKLEID